MFIHVDCIHQFYYCKRIPKAKNEKEKSLSKHKHKLGKKNNNYLTEGINHSLFIF